MVGHRRSATSLLLATLIAAAVSALVLRPRLLRWGATEEETARVLPGDELLPTADAQSTMAVTLPAPPKDVWPWLVQMGCNRAGWYSWDRLDNGGRPSAERIVPEWQDVKLGDHLDATPRGDTWFTVAVMRPPRILVLRTDVALLSGHPFEPMGPLPRAFTQALWGFHLDPTPGGGTRLVVRTRALSRPRLPTKVAGFLFWDPAHVIMQTRQFRNLSGRVGRSDAYLRSRTTEQP